MNLYALRIAGVVGSWLALLALARTQSASPSTAPPAQLAPTALGSGNVLQYLAAAPPPAIPDTLVHDQAELDALLARGFKPAEHVQVYAFTTPAGGTPAGRSYEIKRQIRPSSGGSIVAAPGEHPRITWTGSRNPDVPVFPISGKGVRVAGLTIECGGCDAFAVSGTDHVIDGNTVTGASDFVVINQGGGNLTITRNVVPLVQMYGLYTSGRKVDGKLVTPLDGLLFEGNTIGGSVWGHLVRTQDTINAAFRGNDLTRRCDRPDDGKSYPFQNGCIFKVHDSGAINGGAGHPSIVIENNVLHGGGGVQAGRCGFGPLDGGDGGLKMVAGPERERLLHLMLYGLVFRNNRCDDIFIDVHPGIRELVLDGNVFNNARGTTISWRPTTPFRMPDGTTNKGDYRPWRGEVTGSATHNQVQAKTSAAGKPWCTLPPAVKRSDNTLNGKAA